MRCTRYPLCIRVVYRGNISPGIERTRRHPPPEKLPPHVARCCGSSGRSSLFRMRVDSKYSARLACPVLLSSRRVAVDDISYSVVEHLETRDDDDQGNLERCCNSRDRQLWTRGGQCLLPSFLCQHAVCQAQQHAHYLRYWRRPLHFVVSCFAVGLHVIISYEYKPWF